MFKCQLFSEKTLTSYDSSLLQHHTHLPTHHISAIFLILISTLEIYFIPYICAFSPWLDCTFWKNRHSTQKKQPLNICWLKESFGESILYIYTENDFYLLAWKQDQWVIFIFRTLVLKQLKSLPVKMKKKYLASRLLLLSVKTCKRGN